MNTETDPDRTAAAPDEPAGPVALPSIDPDAYELLGEVARGGMGRIVRARDRRLDRVVAIKQVLGTSPHLAALFEREVRITARLQHPSIVSVYEAGVLPGGELVYAMKLVPGRSLRDVLKGGARGVALLPAVIAIADALAYAHQQRIVHRDLKPGNVLIGEFGEVVVIDWGLAKDLADTTAADDGAMGTPAYMAPEAARGEPVDERADVYAIGAILREVLTGAPPYRGDDRSTVLAAVRAGPPAPMPRDARVPADLAAIVEKAMAHDRAARYPSARELADELRRFQTGQLVSAHAYSLGERARRWLRRNRAPVAVAATAAALVVALVAIGVARIVRERDRARDRADRLTLAQARLELDREPAQALRTLATLPARSRYWPAARVLAADARARGVATLIAARGDVVAVAVAPDGPRALIREESRLLVVGGDRELASWAMPVPAGAAALSADGSTVAAVDVDGELRVWSVAKPDRPVLTLAGPREAPLLALAADGSAIAAAGRDFGLRVWSGDGAEELRDDAARGTTALAVGPGGFVVTSASGTTVTLRAGKATNTFDLGARVVTVAVAPAGDAIACASADGAVWIAPVIGGEPVVVRHDTPATAIAFAAPAPLLVAVSDREVVVWGRDGRRRRVLLGVRPPASAVAIGADGDTVVAADARGVWRWAGLDADATWMPGASAPGRALVSAGDRAVSASGDGAVWTWDLRARRGHLLGGHAAAAEAIAIDPAGTRVATAGDDRTVRLWDLDGGRGRVLGSHLAAALAVAFAPDGETVASGGADHVVRLWNVAPDGGGKVLGQHAGPVTAVAFVPDGSALVSIGDDPEAIVWSVEGDEPRRLVHDAPLSALAMSPDGARIATGTRGGDVTVWPLGGGVPRVVAHHDGAVRAIAFAPDGRHVASAGDDGRGIVATLDGHRVLLVGHDDLVRAIAFSPDGAIVATASDDGTVRLWDAASGEGRTLRAGAWVSAIGFAAGGDAIVATGEGGGLWMWRDDLPRERQALRRAIAEGVP